MMTSWRKPETAPRDGTIIVGLFERRGKRAIALLASFDAETRRELLNNPATASAPEWVRDAEDSELEKYRSDPSHGFQPLTDSDIANECGRMKAWMPAQPPH